MMRIFYLGLIVTVCSTCSLHREPTLSPAESEALRKKQIERWIDEEQYGKAWDSLVSVEANNPNYADYLEQRNKLEKKIQAYENSVIRDTGKLTLLNQWGEALNLYDEALAKLPKSTVLKDHLAEVHNLQASLSDKLVTRLQVIRGEKLIESMSIYRELVTINPRDKTVQKETTALHQESLELGSKLRDKARAHFENDELSISRPLIELAEQLNDDPQIHMLANKIRAKQEEAELRSQVTAKAASRKRKKKQDEHDKALNAKIARFDHLYEKKDYLSAAEVLKKLGNSPRHQREISSRQTRLKKAIRKKTDQLYEQGVKYYSQENYSLALQSWAEVLKLEPDHIQAREYTERATRIVNNIKRLREKQQVIQ